MFVCLGNICRSPAAQGVAERLLEAHPAMCSPGGALTESNEGGLVRAIEFDSAGTADYHTGRPPDARMIQAAKRRGYDLQSLAKTIEPKHLLERDLVVAMDRDNYRNIMCIARGEPKNVMLLSDFLDHSWPRDVPDPYYGGEAGFEYVLDMLEAAIPKIIEHVAKS